MGFRNVKREINGKRQMLLRRKTLWHGRNGFMQLLSGSAER